MKTLLELEKEIPARILAAGQNAYPQAPPWRISAIYAAMRYEEQLTSPRIDHPIAGKAGTDK